MVESRNHEAVGTTARDRRDDAPATDLRPSEADADLGAAPAGGSPTEAVPGNEATSDDDGHSLPEVGALARSVVEAIGRGGSATGASALDVVEGAARALVRRVIEGAIADPRPVEDRRRLARALRQKSGVPGGLGGAGVAAVGTRIARRLGPARFLAKRGPLWLLASAGPAVYSSITHGAEELALVASHLVHRARAAGIEPDPERLRRVAVGLLTGKPVRPDHEPSHGPLALDWGRRAVRASLPFGSSVRTRDADGLARAAAEVDPADVGARPDVIEL